MILAHLHEEIKKQAKNIQLVQPEKQPREGTQALWSAFSLLQEALPDFLWVLLNMSLFKPAISIFTSTSVLTATWPRARPIVGPQQMPLDWIPVPPLLLAQGLTHSGTLFFGYQIIFRNLKDS